MRKSIIIFLLFLTPHFALAQFKAQAKPMSVSDHLRSAQPGVLSILGLDPSKFSMQHSYSMSYASIGGNGYTQGLYLNTMTYQFTMPLSVSLQFGMANNPFQGAKTASILQNGFFISGAKVRYQPFKNTVLQLNFQQRPYQNFPGTYGMINEDFDWFE